MKKILCLLFAVAIFSGTAVGQLGGDNFRLGLYVSPGVSSFSTQNSDIGTSGGPSFGFGLTADLAISDNYAIGSGLNFTYLKGEVDITGQSDLISRRGDYRYGYVEVPVTIKLSTNEVATAIGDFIYFGQIGGFIGLPLLRTRYDFYEESTLIQDNEKAANQVSPINLGLTVAAGAEYAMTENTYLYAALWFNRGFFSVLRNKAFEQFDFSDKDNKVNSSLIGLRVGAMF